MSIVMHADVVTWSVILTIMVLPLCRLPSPFKVQVMIPLFSTQTSALLSDPSPSTADTNDMPAGTTSTIWEFSDESGPALLAVIVKRTFCPEEALETFALFVRVTSADPGKLEELEEDVLEEDVLDDELDDELELELLELLELLTLDELELELEILEEDELDASGAINLNATASATMLLPVADASITFAGPVPGKK